jgi:hypothetical protein
VRRRKTRARDLIVSSGNVAARLGEQRSIRAGRAVRIPTDEIRRFETETAVADHLHRIIVNFGDAF